MLKKQEVAKCYWFLSLLAYFEEIHLGPNQSLIKLLNIWEGCSVFRFKQIVPYVEI